MKNIRAKWGAVLLVALVATTGCGEKAMTLTEEEESTIVNYTAHVVAKYNTKQPDGLARLSADTLDDIYGTDSTKDEEQNTQTDSILDEAKTDETQMDEVPESYDSQGTDTENALPEEQQVTLSEALGIAGVEAAVTGIELKDSYVQEDYFAMDATAGKTYLVVHVSLTNATTADIPCDMLAQKPQFKAKVNGGSAVPAETTILLNDISTYQGVIPMGGSVDTVALFLVSKDQVSQVDTLTLEVNANGVKNEVICQ